MVKKAEDGNDVIIRLYEIQPARRGKVKFYNNIKSVQECNLMKRYKQHNPVEIISPTKLDLSLIPLNKDVQNRILKGINNYA